MDNRLEQDALIEDVYKRQVTNQVVESEEYNNILSFMAPTPTPPLLCTPTLTQAP